ncbi:MULTISPECIES: hypothetical protein [unclassified Chelatococcus]|uniref:hypothetical protein n=1 Tax=unclassified Chelatococcus TaxID=2638111 RepID=UPI0002FBE9C5|nr:MULTISPECIES: hypothetical protein [unclassified Chelatococcus]
MATVSRRHLLGMAALAGTLALGACVTPGTTPLPAGEAEALRLSAISVDISALVAQGQGPFATLVGDSLSEALASAFADRLAPRDRTAPRLVVRLKSLTLSAWSGGTSIRINGTDFAEGGSDSDYLDGEALIVGRRGEIEARYPILFALPSSYSGPWYLADNEQRRAATIAQLYADWVKRKIVGR